MRGGVAQEVEAETGAAATVRSQQAAQHADGCRLAAAIAAEEAADLAFRHLHRQPVDHVACAEALSQVVHVDGQRGHVLPLFGMRRTSTGCPGLSRIACSADGCASIR